MFDISPDCSGNPFVPGFGKKDCSGKRELYLKNAWCLASGKTYDKYKNKKATSE